MKKEFDLLIIGAGPVGLMSAYLAHLSGLSTLIIDKTSQPLQVGRADALNARTLQYLEIVDLFAEIYPKGKPCNTSSVWANGKFTSRQSSWWENLQGTFHKHFLMIGQSHIEQLLDKKLKELSQPVLRDISVIDINYDDKGCLTRLSNGDEIFSHYLIGADGAHSFVRKHFNIPFELVRPQIIWAVVDGIISTDFKKVPEIIVFQAETADVAWIPREGYLDRFYIRMDIEDFTFEQVLERINNAIKPHQLTFEHIEWFSKFSVKESVAENFFFCNKIFIAGDASHVHSVNGGQGLNTGLADAFNLIWKISQVHLHNAPESLLQTYELERKATAMDIVKTSAELVRSTKNSTTGSHANDYLKIVEKRSGFITGMGIQYGNHKLKGTRLYDFIINQNQRVYSLLKYNKYTVLITGTLKKELNFPSYVQVIYVESNESPYSDGILIVRPDAYIELNLDLGEFDKLKEFFNLSKDA